MKILKVFETSELEAIASQNNLPLFRQGQSLVLKNGVEEVEMVLPSIHPLWAKQYLAFDMLTEDGITVAILQPPSQYQFWNGSSWENTINPIFVSPSVIREGLSSWYGAIGFVLKLSKGAILKEVRVGYEVRRDVIDYVLRYLLPQRLAIPIEISLSSRMENGVAPLIFSLNPSRITQASFQPFDTAPLSAIIENHLCRVVGNLSTEGQIHLTLVPQIEYADTDTMYQITEQPCIILRRLEGTKYCYPFLKMVSLSKDEPVQCLTTFAYDQPVEVLVIAPTEAMSNEIAIALMNDIQKIGKLDVPGFDLTLGVFALSPLSIQRSSQLIAGSLPKVSFTLTIKNICFWE